jgi:hypothetical protein
MIESQRARTKLFKSQGFRKEVAERLCHPAKRVAACFDALLEAKRIPYPHPENAAALAADGASILSAIGSQQLRSESIVRVADRLCRMEFQLQVGKPEADASDINSMPQTPSTSFSTDLATVFRGAWATSRGAKTETFRPTALSILWSDEHGQILFGTIEQWSKKKRRNRIYSSAPINAPPFLSYWDSVQLRAVGGSVFAPLPLLGFVELLDLGVEEGAAGLDAVV